MIEFLKSIHSLAYVGIGIFCAGLWALTKKDLWGRRMERNKRVDQAKVASYTPPDHFEGDGSP